MFLISKRAWRGAAAAAWISLIPDVGAAVQAAWTNNAAGGGIEWAVKAGGEFWVDPGTMSKATVWVESPWPYRSVFSQAAIKQDTAPAKLGPNPAVPYFSVRFALPIPPDNDTNLTAGLLGLDASVWSHNHSPGLQVLPNGDVLAIYFSARNSTGANEREASARFVQARLRHGADEWDPPELFFDSRDFNDQSALLWVDGNTVRFFGGGRENPVPFKMATSTDNGASWVFSLPVLDKPASDFTAQPIANAFRDPAGAMYFAMDAEEDQSFLWRSTDGGSTWHDMGGRTGARHSTIVPLSDGRTLLSLGGKNTGVNGFTPENTSTNWGETWSESKQSAFAALGGNQRPSLIRLANGNLCFVTDSYHRRKESPPDGWAHGAGTFVAISKDNGATWRMKRLPVELPHEADRARGTLGYATVAQAPNGTIHVLTTMTHPCLHYEFNEAWVFSEQGDITPESSGGRVETFTERYPDGAVRAKWSARVCSNGRYLLDGSETSFFENGHKEHEANYVSGRKAGGEIYWASDGRKIWSWHRDLKKGTAVWTHYWSNGKKRIESNWNLNPQARDLARNFTGLVANGTATHWDEAGKVSAAYRFSNGVLEGPALSGAAVERPTR